MLARRPFRSTDALLEAARSIWDGLNQDDWLEAFAHHPRIGERSATTATTITTATIGNDRERGGDGAGSVDTRELSAREQRQVASADAGVRAAIAEGNREYEAKFGYIFIICATGRSGESMLAALQERLRNDPAVEIRVAAGEQARITALRLQGLT